jgi:hypothetical protein
VHRLALGENAQDQGPHSFLPDDAIEIVPAGKMPV